MSDSKVQGASTGWRRYQSWSSNHDCSDDETSDFFEDFYDPSGEKISVYEVKPTPFIDWEITVR